jgi:NAD(P)-dependent dehydrogenase (short-subunit alcohol dehydrogenase family)
MKFQNKIAIITGASTGIGNATREYLQQQGCTVYNLDIHAPLNEDPHFIPCDVAKKEDIYAAVDHVFAREKRIDHLFANAGVHLFANLEETSDEQFQRITSTNIGGVFYCLKAIIPIMKKQGHGSIVIMGSDQAFIGKGSSAVYGLTKGAVSQLTKSTAIDYAPFNIRVNCICPGTIDTPLLDRAVDQFSAKSGLAKDEVYKSLDTAQPLGRIGQPEEIAKTVAFLLSDDSSFTTGALFAVDGGYVSQ